MDGRSSLSHGPTLLPELERSVSILSKVEGQRHEKIAAARDRNELQQEEKNRADDLEWEDGRHDPPIFSARRAPPRHRVRRRAEARGCEDGSAQPSNVGCKNVESPPSSIAKISLENAVQLSPRRTTLRVQLLSGRFLALRGAVNERGAFWWTHTRG